MARTFLSVKTSVHAYLMLPVFRVQRVSDIAVGGERSAGILHKAYLAKVKKGLLDRDEFQLKVVDKLDDLLQQLYSYRPDVQRNGLLSKLFAGARRVREPPKGIYLYGAVGESKIVLIQRRCKPSNFKSRIVQAEFANIAPSSWEGAVRCF
ncbi:unnamed protein product [Toxocara canis]|uniref:Dynamin_M domain-containing protein n=1 Tax=Toxocara canis TaxID=6265 RepID=A0A183U6I2_TOXCA|nr:unnamed protein product [Toxocara canis]